MGEIKEHVIKKSFKIYLCATKQSLFAFLIKRWLSSQIQHEKSVEKNAENKQFVLYKSQPTLFCCSFLFFCCINYVFKLYNFMCK